MNKIKFGTGKEYILAQPAGIEGRFERGAQREVMTLIFPLDAGLDDILADVRNAKATANITLLTGEDGKTPYEHTDYSIFLAGGIESVERADADGVPQHTELIVVRLGCLTYIEKQLLALGVKI